MKKALVFLAMLVLLVAIVVPASGQEVAEDGTRNAYTTDDSPVVGVASTPGQDCAGGLTHHNSVENGYRVTGANGVFVEQFTAPAGNDWSMVTVCTCWLSLGGGITVNYEVVVYDDDGAGGQPGTELYSLADTAVNPATALPGAWYGSAVTLALPESETFYIGVRFNGSQDAFFCSDEAGGVVQTGYRSPDGGSTWGLIQAMHNNYIAMGVAFLLEAVIEPEPAVPAVNYPNRGEILISAGAPVVPYAAPGEYAQAFTLPADYDGNGFDTYVITGTATVGGATWYSIWVGGVDYLWVPASQVQFLR